ncbi:hypothetical protein DL768_007159 [Monosporascus sp. mg162]|nr:hypothetical protein DL768_007159 [Monosporascus sp. mg162]
MHSSMDYIFDFTYNDISNPQPAAVERELPPFIDPAALSDSSADFTPSSQESVQDQPQSVFGDLLNLCKKVADNQETLASSDDVACSAAKASPNSMETNVQCALANTSHLTDILKHLVAAETPVIHRRSSDSNSPQPVSSSPRPSVAASFSHLPGPRLRAETADSDHSSLAYAHYAGYQRNFSSASSAEQSPAPPKPTPQDILLTTALVTAYVLLIRAWRCIFGQIFRLLANTPGEEAVSFLILPSMRLGGFQVQNSPTTQIRILLELGSGMLRQIETCLGISQHPSGFGATADDGGLKPLALTRDLVSISMRDTILSQESFRVASGDGNSDQSLRRMMHDIRQQLDRRG